MATLYRHCINNDVQFGPLPWLSTVENENFILLPQRAPSNEAGGSILEHSRYDYVILGSVAAVQ